mmetsp:Transcript_5077/g.16580  ORF Transcript_5077/g.16580 Transcript_5077/m.16580 type:complete len:436 (-) Transcript_5077:732-2039(-)
MARALRQRSLMSVDYDCGAPDCSGGLTIHSEQKGSTYLSQEALAAFDCPWQGLLNSDAGGLCLPYQEATLPYGDIDEQRNAGSLVCPVAGKYHPGEKVALGDNYGCAAPRPAWPADDSDANGNALPLSPICKTYVDDCKYSVGSTRKYTSKYTINHLLLSIGLASEASDTGKYPSAGTKGDDSEDGECTKADAAAQWLDCGIPCPVGDNARMEAEDMRGFGGAVLGFMGLCGILGGLAFKFVGGSSERFFVAGRSMPLVVVTATLASQSLDSNAALGNIDLGYYYHWWDGACLPIGLGLSLILNGIFFAKRLNEMRLLTLPDLFARTFGPLAECVFSLLGITSFICLLGGNLVGSGRIIGYIFGIDVIAGIWTTTAAVWLYTIAGGLVSVAYTSRRPSAGPALLRGPFGALLIYRGRQASRLPILWATRLLSPSR